MFPFVTVVLIIFLCFSLADLVTEDLSVPELPFNDIFSEHADILSNDQWEEGEDNSVSPEAPQVGTDFSQTSFPPLEIVVPDSSLDTLQSDCHSQESRTAGKLRAREGTVCATDDKMTVPQLDPSTLGTMFLPQEFLQEDPLVTVITSDKKERCGEIYPYNLCCNGDPHWYSGMDWQDIPDCYRSMISSYVTQSMQVLNST